MVGSLPGYDLVIDYLDRVIHRLHRHAAHGPFQVQPLPQTACADERGRKRRLRVLLRDAMAAVFGISLTITFPASRIRMDCRLSSVA